MRTAVLSRELLSTEDCRAATASSSATATQQPATATPLPASTSWGANGTSCQRLLICAMCPTSNVPAWLADTATRAFRKYRMVTTVLTLVSYLLTYLLCSCRSHSSKLRSSTLWYALWCKLARCIGTTCGRPWRKTPHSPHPTFSQLVELKTGETYNGNLVSCDNFMNIHLRDVIITSKVRI